MTGPLGCENGNRTDLKKSKKQIVTEDKSEDAKKKIQDSGKKIVKG